MCIYCEVYMHIFQDERKYSSIPTEFQGTIILTDNRKQSVWLVKITKLSISYFDRINVKITERFRDDRLRHIPQSDRQKIDCHRSEDHFYITRTALSRLSLVS